MDEKYFTITKTICLLVQLLLMFAPQLTAHHLYCPHTCICVMDDILEDNNAECTFANSSVEVKWVKDLEATKEPEAIKLEIHCQNVVQNFIYDCSDWPQYNIRSDHSTVAVTGCAPSLLRCVHKMFRPISQIVTVKFFEMAGSYSENDLIDYEHVGMASLHLKDGDSLTPGVVINSLLALNSLIIIGGKLNLSSNLARESKLTFLFLHGMSISSIPQDAFNGMPNLISLFMEANNIGHIGANAFRGVNTLGILSINNNTLATIEPGAFSNMTRLNILYMNDNTINKIPNGLWTGTDKLFIVSIKNNKVEITLDTDAFANRPLDFTEVDMTNSKVKELPEHVFNQSIHIKRLKFANTSIEYLPPKIFSTLIILTEVHLSKNRIRDLPNDLFFNAPLLEHVDLSYNQISTLKEYIFRRNPRLKEIDLSYNKLSHVDREVFNGTSLRKLTLASNKLQRIIGNTTLQWQTQLLNLSHNELKVFEDWFTEIVGLESLDLSENKIRIIKTSHIQHLRNIIIDLRKNLITGVERVTYEPILNVTTNNISLFLSNNPLQCDCEVTTLLKEWHKYGILADYEDITCDKEGKLSNLDAYVQCNKTHALVALVGSIAVGTLVIIVILLSICTQRNHIWDNVRNFFESIYWRYISKRNIVNETIEMKEEIKQYDLFISFAHKDADFVVDQLLPVLENDLELKVCVHYRDWVVGDLIPVQIRESVESSIMTMIILTKHFLESEWSSLEFRTAHELSIEDGRSRVIIVLIDKSVTRHDKLCGDLKAYIDMNTYIVWDDTFFWDKLQKILPKRWQTNK